jgi:1-deoxy-D-xylulose-5-phosphate reductoisomerase
MTKKRISILGSTGSIGRQSLEIIREFPDQFDVIGLSASTNITLLQSQILEFLPQFACISDPNLFSKLESFITSHSLSTQPLLGEPGLKELCSFPQDLLVMAIVGTAGVYPTSIAIQQGTTIALACKEVLVAAGPQIMTAAHNNAVTILPIDSEHAALKQCLAGIQEDSSQISRLILTASGGPFWNTPQSEFASITPESALKHPNWDMGGKISIDSATMMNKGLELIEAHFLFNVPYEKLDVIIHPQSIIHSIVEFTDGTMLSQMGLPDMRFPIQYALTYPKKWPNPWPKTSLASLKALAFHDPDYDKFPLLKIAIDCGKHGQTYPVVMNAANESAVSLFLLQISLKL